MLVVGQEPELVDFGNELQALGDDDLMAEMWGVETSPEEGDVHGCIISRFRLTKFRQIISSMEFGKIINGEVF